jgi:hypothetical protein
MCSSIAVLFNTIRNNATKHLKYIDGYHPKASWRNGIYCSWTRKSSGLSEFLRIQLRTVVCPFLPTRLNHSVYFFAAGVRGWSDAAPKVDKSASFVFIPSLGISNLAVQAIPFMINRRKSSLAQFL